MRSVSRFVLLVAGLLLALGLVGCSGTNTSDTDVTDQSTDSATDTVGGDTAADTASDTAADSVPTDTTAGDTTDTTVGDTTNGGSGCGVEPGNVEVALDVAGESRRFVLSMPANYDANTPQTLIYAVHGLGGSGMLAQAYFGIQQEAGNSAVIVYPNALPLANFGGATGWELMPDGYDFAFFDALHAHLTSNLCIDESRVFVTGHSFGGYMSNALGCHRGDRFAAIAPVAGGGPYGACDNAVPTWLTHGSADDVVPLSEGTGARDAWAATNGCGTATSDVAPAGCVAYTGCDQDLHWCQHTGGHEWPAFAAEAIWDFFQTH